ncbi:hypothetical protein CK1_39670 [Ruminococcus sp. SR1/5]|nr:hypothetical protein CK1_39670 [Ruminococcus sp. SR1/5]
MKSKNLFSGQWSLISIWFL